MQQRSHPPELVLLKRVVCWSLGSLMQLLLLLLLLPLECCLLLLLLPLNDPGACLLLAA
jgi:hypothetical protein